MPPPRLTADGVLFTRPAYDALRADYAWLNQALALKNQRLAAAAAVDTSTTRLLARAQADLAASRTNEHNSFRAEQDLMAKYARSVARERPFFLLDKRLYLGGGIGLGLGVLGTAYLLARWH